MKIPRTKKVKKCLLCKNNKLKKIFSLGDLFISNFVKKSKINKGVKAPLTLMYCSKCTLLHNFPQSQNSFLSYLSRVSFLYLTLIGSILIKVFKYLSSPFFFNSFNELKKN